MVCGVTHSINRSSPHGVTFTSVEVREVVVDIRATGVTEVRLGARAR